MEFPHLGQHCNEATCHRLDFLPMKCDSCNAVFCSSHFNYEAHACPGAHRKNVQVPICPLCGEPVPTAPGVSPDLTVGSHIDKQCKSESKKVFTNRCSYKGCKRKELVPVTCSQCKFNYCLRHRHTADHECSAVAATGQGATNRATAITLTDAEQRKLAANAAEYRRSHKPTTLFNTAPKPGVVAARAAAVQRNSNTAAATAAPSTLMQNVQGDMTEDEALARALALSIMELDETADRNRREQAAAAAAASQPNATVRVGGRESQQPKDKCSLS